MSAAPRAVRQRVAARQRVRLALAGVTIGFVAACGAPRRATPAESTAAPTAAPTKPPIAAPTEPSTEPPADAVTASGERAERAPRASAPALSALAGQTVEGRVIGYTRLGWGDRSILIVATIHGDEAAGTPLVEELLAALRADGSRLDGRRVVLVPVVNPDGRASSQRTNSRGVDLNRNFPAANHRPGSDHGVEPLSEPESRALAGLIARHAPDVVVSIHQPAACVDFDGPAADLARAMSQACGLPVRQLGSRPGSLGSHLGLDQGIPIVTLELPRSADQLERELLWKLYGPALLIAVAWDG